LEKVASNLKGKSGFSRKKAKTSNRNVGRGKEKGERSKKGEHNRLPRQKEGKSGGPDQLEREARQLRLCLQEGLKNKGFERKESRMGGIEGV